MPKPPSKSPDHPKGPPPWRGKPPGSGIAREQGTPPEKGRPPGTGVPKGLGKPPDAEGVVVRGTAGQMDRGAPGQLDPWAENPWAPGEGLDGVWTGIPPVGEPDDTDTFYMQHPNFVGEKEPDKPS
jgi:hypothetical protein